MHVAIAGAHGQIALRVTALLTADGDTVTGLIRNPDHAGDVSQAGGSPVLRDLEHASEEDLAAAIRGSDAVVFAAGAGPGSGAARKLTLDRDGAIKLCRAATVARVNRYVMISGAGVEDPPGGDEVFEIYLRAKAEADAVLMASELEWTSLRPGGLTDDPGTGRVRIETTPLRDSIPRPDVARVLAEVVQESRAIGDILYISAGDRLIDDALSRALAPAG